MGGSPGPGDDPDFESLLRDSSHDGWLTGEVIAAIMRADAALADAFMIDPNVWTAYVTGRQREEGVRKQ